MPPRTRSPNRPKIGRGVPPNALAPASIAGVMRSLWKRCQTEAAALDAHSSPAHATVWRDLGTIIKEIGPRVVARLEQAEDDVSIQAERARAAADMPDDEQVQAVVEAIEAAR